ncbi:MAG TPA: diguanylate cyclase [Acidimicrobiales bacterium]
MIASTAAPNTSTTAPERAPSGGRLTFDRLVRRFPGDVVTCIRAQRGGFLVSLDSRYRVIELNHAAEQALGLRPGDQARGDFTSLPAPVLRERRPARLAGADATSEGVLLGVPGGVVFVGDRRSCRRLTLGRTDVAGHLLRSGADPLTGLPDARDLRSQAAPLASDADLGGWPIALLLVALDGDEASDDGVRTMAQTITRTLRDDDLVARVTEGVLGVLVDVDRNDAATVAGRLQLALAVSGGATASVGIAVRQPFELFDLALERAATGLRAARALGSDRISVG